MLHIEHYAVKVIPGVCHLHLHTLGVAGLVGPIMNYFYVQIWMSAPLVSTTAPRTLTV